MEFDQHNEKKIVNANRKLESVYFLLSGLDNGVHYSLVLKSIILYYSLEGLLIKGVFLVTTTIAFVPVKRDYSVNTFS